MIMSNTKEEDEDEDEVQLSFDTEVSAKEHNTGMEIHISDNHQGENHCLTSA